MSKYSARFAKEAYNMLKNKKKQKNVDQINKNISDTGFYVVASKSSADILYLQNDDTKQIHIAMRGTDVSGRKTGLDVRQDLNFALGRSDKHTKKNENKIKKLVKQAPEDYTVHMSGHSLGNVAGTNVLKHSGEARRRISSMDSFNGAHSPFSKKVSKKVNEELKTKITNHKINGDIVSASSAINSVGTNRTYEGKNNNRIKKIPKALQPVFKTLDQLKTHSIDNFVPDEHIDDK